MAHVTSYLRHPNRFVKPHYAVFALGDRQGAARAGHPQGLGEGDLAISAAVEPDVEGHQAARGERQMVEARFPYWK
jgi:hypothetical protein